MELVDVDGEWGTRKAKQGGACGVRQEVCAGMSARACGWREGVAVGGEWLYPCKVLCDIVRHRGLV